MGPFVKTKSNFLLGVMKACRAKTKVKELLNRNGYKRDISQYCYQKFSLIQTWVGNLKNICEGVQF